MKKIIAAKILEGSLAERAGICPGDAIVSINEMSFGDILEYKFLINDEAVLIELKKPDGEGYVVEIENHYQDLGIEFENPLIDEPRHCNNKCIFCFIDQLPKGLRETLYFKDDDTRLSLLHGNFVTLTNMSDAEIDNIIYMHLSPIYISVHTTNPDLRRQMLHNARAGNLLPRMKKLSDSGIIMRTQLVLCPGINDGAELERTLDDLAGLSGVENISLVPVGLTKHRNGLYPLRAYTRAEAQGVIELCRRKQEEFLRIRGEKLCHASDEFYLLAGWETPSVESYGDGVNLEDGVGLLSVMREGFFETLAQLPPMQKKRSVSIATGVDAYPSIAEYARRLMERCEGLSVCVYPIQNDFFGHGITVTGLLTGGDIIAQLQGKPLGDELLLASCMFRHGESVFLDDKTADDAERALGVKVRIVYDGQFGKPFIEAVLDMSIADKEEC